MVMELKEWVAPLLPTAGLGLTFSLCRIWSNSLPETILPRYCFHFLAALGHFIFSKNKGEKQARMAVGDLYILIPQVDNVDHRVKLVKLMHFLS